MPRISFIVLALLLLVAATARAQELSRFENAIRTGTSEDKRNALFEIRNLRSAEASRIAVAALSDADPIVRATAASSVVFLSAAEAVAALVPGLADKEPFVRAETAYALGKVGAPAAIPALAALIGKGRDRAVMNAAIFSLGEIGDVAALSTLTVIFSERPGTANAFARSSAAKAIGKIAERSQESAPARTTPESFLPDKYKLSVAGPQRDLTRGSEDFRRAAELMAKILENRRETADARREAAFAIGAITGGASDALSNCAADADYYLAEICKEGLAKSKPR